MELNDTLISIFARKSVRKFVDFDIDKKTLELITQAGMAAPSAVDKRPWDFIIITNKELLAKLGNTLPYAKCALQASAGIIVCGDTNKQYNGPEADYWITDCSAAIQNILIAVESFGLGAVWTAVYPEKERIHTVKETLGIPAGSIPLAFIPLGKPDGSEKAKDKYDESMIHWNNW